MAYTLLQLVDRVAAQIGLAQPSAVIGSTDAQVIQLQALAEQLGQDLICDFEWQRLTKPYYFTTTLAASGTANVSSATNALTGFNSVSGITIGMVISGPGIAPYSEVASVTTASGLVTMTYPATLTTASASLNFATQDYPLPSDYDRIISDTNWGRTDHWRNLGNKSAQEWQWLQGGIISIGPRERYRIIGNKLRYFAAPTSPLNIAYEYISNAWIIASGGSSPTLTAFVNDADTFVYPDAVMIHGLKYYWFEAKGLDFSVHMDRFEKELSRAKAQDVPVATHSLAAQMLPELVGPWSTPEGSWPQGSS
jgi:hypothetical protein